MSDQYMSIPVSEFEALHERARRTEDALRVEHEIQRQLIARLGIEWVPGEPFYALVADEITRLRTAGLQLAADTATESVLQDEEIRRLHSVPHHHTIRHPRSGRYWCTECHDWRDAPEDW